jgi:hypothetical protein
MPVQNNIVTPISSGYTYDNPVTSQSGGASQIIDIPVNQPLPTQTYVSSSPLGNVKVYDLDSEIEPVQTPIKTHQTTMSQSLIDTIKANQTTSTTPATTDTPTTTDTPAITTTKKTNYLLYGGGAVLVALIVYKLVKK